MTGIFKNRKQADLESKLIDPDTIKIGEPIDLAVWSVKKTGIRCKIITSQHSVTFRKVHREIEGEIITVIPSKVWRFKNTVYMTGETKGWRLDVNALGLKPLGLKDMGVFEPDNESELVENDDPFLKYYLPILAYGSRQKFKMEQVIPFYDINSIEDDPITKAASAFEVGDYATANQILEELLGEDLRCVDAHAHLGNWMFNQNESLYVSQCELAKRHFEVGIKIAEQSLWKNFQGLLPWSYLDNRPYLRCLHGYGLSLWREGKNNEAYDIFEKMLWLNPYDNQGVRNLLLDIDNGKSWESISNG